MSEMQSRAAAQRFKREGLDICPTCNGSGLVVAPSVIARARKGGVASSQRSLHPEQLSMSERGKKGGRPKDPTLASLLDALDRGADPPSL